MRLIVPQEVDELGEPHAFTWDLFPIVEATKTLHLGENGLPKVGTMIEPGMIIVARIGKSASFDPDNQPTALEVHAWPFEQLRQKYGTMWIDSSVYADASLRGRVTNAFCETTPHGLKQAGVELDEKDDQSEHEQRD